MTELHDQPTPPHGTDRWGEPVFGDGITTGSYVFMPQPGQEPGERDVFQVAFVGGPPGARDELVAFGWRYDAAAEEWEPYWQSVGPGSVPTYRVAGEQQNETPEAVSRPTRYEVNLVPETDDPDGIYAITVEYRGDNRWAVLRHSLCLSLDGQWDRERNSSEREEEWLDAHRFDLDTALRLAEEQAVDIAPAKWSGRDRKPQHVGGRVNAEDCPACHGTNPPYPFICPGPSAP